MNNEIKEILECIKDKTRDYVGVNGCYYQDLDRKELDILLDYITNLQEENKELNRMCELYSKSLYNADLTKAEERIDKAVEYCKETLVLKEEYNDEVECVIDDLLSILRGEDNE